MNEIKAFFYNNANFYFFPFFFFSWNLLQHWTKRTTHLTKKALVYYEFCLVSSRKGHTRSAFVLGRKCLKEREKKCLS